MREVPSGLPTLAGRSASLPRGRRLRRRTQFVVRHRWGRARFLLPRHTRTV